jgi:hypothetical protein
MEQEQPSSIFEMNMDAGAQSSISSVSKWMRFISISGFVALGLVLLIFSVAGQEIFKKLSVLSDLGSNNLAGMIVVIVLIIVAVAGTWMFLMFKASTQLKKGIESKNTAELADGFKALRTYFVFSIVMSCLSILYALSTILNF